MLEITIVIRNIFKIGNMQIKTNAKKTAGKRQLSKIQTREKILAAARSEFAGKGYHGASIRELASAAGVSTGAFYGNFDNKREIFETIMDEIYITMKSIIDDAATDLIANIKNTPSGKLTSEMVRKLVDKIFREAMKNIDLFDILRREGLGRDPEYYNRFKKVWESFVDAAKRGMQVYVDEGLAGPYDTELVARAVVPMVIAMLLYAKKATPERVNEIIDTLAAMIDGGVMKLTSWKEERVNGNVK